MEFECAETVKEKPTGNGLGFITYSNKIKFSSKSLDNSGYIITQWKKLVKKQAIMWLKTSGRSQKVIKVGKSSENDDILTVEEEKYPLLEIG